MRSSVATPLVAAWLLVAVGAGAAGASSMEGLLDVEFERLDRPGSSTLLTYTTAAPLLVLVVWNSECPDCLENVRQAENVDLDRFDAYLVGVNHDLDRWSAIDFIAAEDIGSPQLHDPRGLVAEALDARLTSFTFAVIDSTGVVLGLVHDKVPQARVAIEDALLAAGQELAARQAGAAAVMAPGGADAGAGEASGAAITSAPGSAAPTSAAPGSALPGYPLLRTSGRTRVRWLAVGVEDEFETDSCRIEGPYGEALAPTVSLIYRFDYDIVVQVDPHVSAGGRLRISNEDPEILREGPVYFSNEFGSAFFQWRSESWSGRLGFYDVHFTPLTLMRWDHSDNPPVAGSGGSGGCGVCGGGGRGIRLEALDDLRPDITFEGARTDITPAPWFAFSAIYARPLAARDYSNVDPGSFSYRQDLWGARAALSPRLVGDRRAEIGAVFVGTQDAADSADWPPFLPDDPLSFIETNAVTSVFARLPVPGGFTASAEYATSYSRVDRIDARGPGFDGQATVVELARTSPRGLRGAVAWLHLDEDFAASYAALSYRPNTQGPRISVGYVGDVLGLNLFYKDLERSRECDVCNDDPRRTTIASALVTVKPMAHTTLDVAGTFARRTFARRTFAGPTDGELECEQIILTASIRRELARKATVWVDFTKIIAGSDPDRGNALADIGSVYVSVEF